MDTEIPLIVKNSIMVFLPSGIVIFCVGRWYSSCLTWFKSILN